LSGGKFEEPHHARKSSAMKLSTSRIPALWLAAVLCSTGQASSALDTVRLIVDLDKPGHPVPPALHGLFFEDINYAADGGLYAELVQNRSFEDRDPLLAWSQVARGGAGGRLTVESEAPLNAHNTHFLRIYVTSPGSQGFGAANIGFDGMVLRAGEDYLFSVYARRRAGDAAALHVMLEDSAGRALASAKIASAGLAWEKHDAVLTSASSVTNARLVVLATDPGVVDVDMVSLFPRKTFKNRRNGLRAGLDRRAHEIILQLVNPYPAPLDTDIRLNGLKKAGVNARVTTLACADAEAENILGKPERVHPRMGALAGIAPEFTYTLAPNSLTTLRIPQK
jgi:hypothetical protein